MREWATVWPNRYRAIAIPEMAAYASLQDFDAVLLFGYEIVRDAGALKDFDHQADPPVWGLYALGAQSFLRGDVAPAPFSAALQHTPETLYKWPNTLTNLHRLSWFVRLNSTLAGSPPVMAAHPSLQRLASRAGRPRVRKQTLPPALSVWPVDSGVLPDLLAYFRAAGAPVDPKMLETGALRASSAQITRDQPAGRLMISSPCTVAVCGELPFNRSITVGAFSLVTPTNVGALMAVSLDGRPLATSKHFVVKMVSRAENTGQSLATAPPGAPGRYHIENWGKAPVKTFGRSSGVMILRRGRQTILSLALRDGTWELLVRDGKATLACDTPAILGAVFEKRVVTGTAPVTLTVEETSRPATANKTARR